MKRLFRKKTESQLSSNHSDLDTSSNQELSQLPPSPPSGYNSNSAFPQRQPISTVDPVEASLDKTLPQPTKALLTSPTPSDDILFKQAQAHQHLSKSSELSLSNNMSHTKKKPGFLARFQPKHSLKSTHPWSGHHQVPSEVERCIVWLCAAHEHTEDWAQVLEFCDRLSTSEVDCKQAVHSLRKELKHGSQVVQLRAVRLTVILVLNSTDRLRLQIASKKFLETVEEVFYKSSKTPEGQPVREMILKAFSALGYEFQRDGDLQAFTHLYNKIKPADSPMGGAPLDESDLTFTPGSTNQHRTRPHQAAVPVQPNMPQPTVMPEMRDLRAEAEVARSNARLLIEALAYTTPLEMDDNELIQEFHAKCLQNQNQLLDDIPWATAQAEQARAYAIAASTHQPLPQTNPYAPLINGVSTGAPNVPTVSREEQLLAILLAANSDLVDAFRQYDEMSRLARNEKEMRMAEERSKVETRLDRSSEPLDTQIGASGSSQSPPRVQMPAPSPPSRVVGSRNPFGDEMRRAAAAEGYIIDETEGAMLGSAEPFSSESIPSIAAHAPPLGSSPPQSPDVDWLGSGTMSDEPQVVETSRLDPTSRANSTDEPIPMRLEPSEKALGKMRRISGVVVKGESGGIEEADEEELNRRREEVELKFRERYRLAHQQQQNPNSPTSTQVLRNG